MIHPKSFLDWNLLNFCSPITSVFIEKYYVFVWLRIMDKQDFAKFQFKTDVEWMIYVVVSLAAGMCWRFRVLWTVWLFIPPASTKLKAGYTGFTLSVCPSVNRILSALYLQQYLSYPFHICTSYQATSEGVSCVTTVSKLKNLKFWRIL